ncbi:hypothetical protein TNCV_3029321 [Trichonephila clavipes]|nr:hypothetical protein TNCV_3029321 [Trichonephila clavipes]
MIPEVDSSINELGPVANLLEPVEIIVPENPLPFEPDNELEEDAEPDYGNRPFRTFAINGRYRAGESLALEHANHCTGREYCIYGILIVAIVVIIRLIIYLITRKKLEDLENTANESKD